VQRLGNRLNRADHHHLIARLGDLPGAVVADMHDLPAEQLEQRPHALEHRRLAADHDRQRRGDGALLTAGNRRIEHVDAVRDRRCASERAISGAMVLMSTSIEPAASPSARPSAPERHLLDVGIRR
jgi:hypothetical protein